MHVRDQAGEARDQEDRVADFIGEPEIGADLAIASVTFTGSGPPEIGRVRLDRRSVARITARAGSGWYSVMRGLEVF